MLDDQPVLEAENVKGRVVDAVPDLVGEGDDRTLIHERIWGYDEQYASNTLEVLVSSLRRKLDSAGANRIVHTVRGVGYVARPDADPDAGQH